MQGLLGHAMAANHRGRLSHFIVDERSPAIAMFGAAPKQRNEEGDWYGEHAGKWLVAASKAAARSGDRVLTERIRRVADFLVAQQEPDGYLGTYAPRRRFTLRQPPKPLTWDGAPALRTWDLWIHAYLVLGLLEVHRLLGSSTYLVAARAIGDLCWRTLHDDGIDITTLGNHHGLSATVLMDPAVELFFATGERRYLDLALLILEQADRHPPLALLTRALQGVDASEIATGKSYQLLWNLVGLAKLHRATGVADYLTAVENMWWNVRDHHLTLGGGPWGGVAHRSREVFNPGGFFSPHGYVETCSVLAWIQLNRELLSIGGDARYADEIERTAFNDLVGAMAPDGEDWCYYSYPNGRRVHTTYWRCCKSSGAMALEELPALTCRVSAEGAITIDLYGAGTSTLTHPGAGHATFLQTTAYPFEPTIRIRVEVAHAARFTLRLRIPGWASASELSIADAFTVESAPAGTYAAIDRTWRNGDEVILRLPMSPEVHRRTSRNVQESRAPDGAPVLQEVMRYDHLAVTHGPLVYATGLIDGFKTGETIRAPDSADGSWLEVVPASSDDAGATIRLHPSGRPPIDFVPYYRAGGRVDGAWRLTWLSLAPET